MRAGRSLCKGMRLVQDKPLLDRIDRNILTVLQRDGRIPNKQLADQIALSPSACLARVKRLEREGIIMGYKAQVDPARLGPGITIFAEITVSGHDLKSTRRIEAALDDIPEAIEAYQVSGDYDFLVRFLMPDMESWTALVDELTSSDLTIKTIRTVASMRKMKGWVGVPARHGLPKEIE